MPSTRAAVSPSRSRTTRSAITSRSPALRVCKRGFERRRETFAERLVDALRERQRIPRGAGACPRRGTSRARWSGRSRATRCGRSPRRGSKRPQRRSAFSNVARGQILGRLAVPRQVEEVAVDVVEVLLGRLRERHGGALRGIGPSASSRACTLYAARHLFVTRAQQRSTLLVSATGDRLPCAGTSHGLPGAR